MVSYEENFVALNTRYPYAETLKKGKPYNRTGRHKVADGWLICPCKPDHQGQSWKGEIIQWKDKEDLIHRTHYLHQTAVLDHILQIDPNTDAEVTISIIFDSSGRLTSATKKQWNYWLRSIDGCDNWGIITKVISGTSHYKLSFKERIWDFKDGIRIEYVDFFMDAMKI